MPAGNSENRGQTTVFNENRGLSPIFIVGGGWAGIACALELADAGVAVALYESARQPGGRARRVDWDGLAIDNGQHLMVGAYRETLRMMARLGTLHHLQRAPLRLISPGFALRLPRLPAPWHLAIGLLGCRGLSLADKLAAARLMRALQARAFRLPADLPAAPWLADQRQSSRLIERLWAPICIAALNTPLDTASAQVFCNVLRDSLAGPRDASDLLFNRADLGHLLADAALRYLRARGAEVNLAHRVSGLRRRADGYDLAISASDRHHCMVASHVILACHPARLPALLADLPPMQDIARAVARYRWQPIVTLWLRFAAPIAFPFPMHALGDGQAPWAFERNDIAPGVVAIVASAEGPHVGWAAETLRDVWLDALRATLGPLPPLWAWTRIVERRATYACEPGMARPDNVTPLPGLYLAGDYTAGDYPATLEGAVRSGVQCARHILAARALPEAKTRSPPSAHA